MIAPIQDAIDAGIAVFTVDTFIEPDIALANIASDNVEGGRIAARALAELIGEQGKVYVTNVIAGISTTDQRQEGFEEEIAAYPDIDLPRRRVQRRRPDRPPPRRRRPNSRPTRTWPASSAPTSSAPRAPRPRSSEAGKQGQVKIVGFDAGPQQVQDCSDGDRRRPDRPAPLRHRLHRRQDGRRVPDHPSRRRPRRSSPPATRW